MARAGQICGQRNGGGVGGQASWGAAAPHDRREEVRGLMNFAAKQAHALKSVAKSFPAASTAASKAFAKGMRDQRARVKDLYPAQASVHSDADSKPSCSPVNDLINSARGVFKKDSVFGPGTESVKEAMGKEQLFSLLPTTKRLPTVVC